MKRGGKQTYLMPHHQHCARYSHSCKENKTQWDVKKDREVHKKVQGVKKKKKKSSRHDNMQNIIGGIVSSPIQKSESKAQYRLLFLE